jgi:hypothetical protein
MTQCLTAELTGMIELFRVNPGEALESVDKRVFLGDMPRRMIR